MFLKRNSQILQVIFHRLKIISRPLKNLSKFLFYWKTNTDMKRMILIQMTTKIFALTMAVNLKSLRTFSRVQINLKWISIKTYLKQKFWNLHRGIMDFSELTIFKSDCEATKTFYKDIYRLSGLNVILINHTLQVKFTGLLIIFVIGK